MYGREWQQERCKKTEQKWRRNVETWRRVESKREMGAERGDGWCGRAGSATQTNQHSPARAPELWELATGCLLKIDTAKRAQAARSARRYALLQHGWLEKEMTLSVEASRFKPGITASSQTSRSKRSLRLPHPSPNAPQLPLDGSCQYLSSR
jgi:hypothetical protein